MRRRAVTIVELLVVVAVLAILLGILLPTLRGGKRASRDTIDLANLRSIHQQFRLWGNDHQDRFVNAGVPPPGEPLTLSAGPGNGSVVGPYLMQGTYWPLILSAWGEPGTRSWHSQRTVIGAEWQFLGVGAQGGVFVRPSAFVYSFNLLTHPARWMPPACNTDSSELERYNTVVYWSSVAYPGRKGMMIDRSAEPDDAAASFVDGSARLFPAGRFSETAPGCLGGFFSPVIATPFGYLGVDE